MSSPCCTAGCSIARASATGDIPPSRNRPCSTTRPSAGWLPTSLIRSARERHHPLTVMGLESRQHCVSLHVRQREQLLGLVEHDHGHGRVDRRTARREQLDLVAPGPERRDDTGPHERRLADARRAHDGEAAAGAQQRQGATELGVAAEERLRVVGSVRR